MRSSAMRCASLGARRGWQVAKPQEVAGFFESGVVGQFVNIDATIGQNALIAIDVADAGGGCDYSLQSLRGALVVRLDMLPRSALVDSVAIAGR